MSCYKIILCFLASHAYALRVDTSLPDGDYELVPETESEQQDAKVNTITVAEDPDQSPEEPKASAQEGKHRSMTLISKLNLLYLWDPECDTFPPPVALGGDGECLAATARGCPGTVGALHSLAGAVIQNQGELWERLPYACEPRRGGAYVV